jgi:hypothetical protein
MFGNVGARAGAGAGAGAGAAAGTGDGVVEGELLLPPPHAENTHATLTTTANNG